MPTRKHRPIRLVDLDEANQQGDTVTGPFDDKTLSKDTVSPATSHDDGGTSVTTTKGSEDGSSDSDDDADKSKKIKVAKVTKVEESGIRDHAGRFDSDSKLADPTRTAGTYIDKNGKAKYALYTVKDGKRVRVGTTDDESELRKHLGLHESQRISLRDKLTFHPTFLEGTYNPDTRTADVIIISEGVGNSRDGHWYSADTLEKAVANGVFEGAQAYADHPSESEEQDRPERSVRDLVGYFFDCKLVEANGTPAIGAKFKIQEGVDWAVGLIKTAIQYAKQFPGKSYAGISINADGDVEPVRKDGRDVNHVHEITSAFSADIVTKPARGGKFLALRESAAGARKHEGIAMDAKKLSEAAKELQAQAKAGFVDQDKLAALLEAAADAQTLVKTGAMESKTVECSHGKGAMECSECKEAGLANFGDKKAKPFTDSDDDNDDDSDDDNDDDSDDSDDDSKDDKKGKKKPEIVIQESERFRKANPSLYREMLAEAQRAVAADTKATIADLQRKLAEERAKNTFRESIEVAKTKLKESDLPTAAATRLLPQLVGKDVAEIETLIEAERNYIAEFGGATRVGGNPEKRTQVRESERGANNSAIFAGLGV